MSAAQDIYAGTREAIERCEPCDCVSAGDRFVFVTSGIVAGTASAPPRAFDLSVVVQPAPTQPTTLRGVDDCPTKWALQLELGVFYPDHACEAMRVLGDAEALALCICRMKLGCEVDFEPLGLDLVQGGARAVWLLTFTYTAGTKEVTNGAS